MKISIVTAVYNGGSSIRATLESVARQDHQLIEHIIVDGGSSDSTLATVRRYGERISHLISEPDNGVYDAFNKGLRIATGDVIAFLNCGDTYISPGVLSMIAHEFSRGGARATLGDVLIVDPLNHARVIRRYSSKRFSPQDMAWGWMPAHPALFLHRDVYQKAGEYDTRFRIAGDFEFCLRVFVKLNTPFRYISEALVRMPRGGLSNRGWRSSYQITKEMRQACALNEIHTNWLKLSSRFPRKLLELM